MENQTDQQKEAIILFIELAGFDRLSEKLGSDKASGLFNVIFKKNERIITFAGGRVDKYIGFCQLAVFGSENKAGKTTEKALNAALEIREHFNEFMSEHKLEQLSGIKMGMNAGPVVTAAIGVGDKKSLTVLGETVDKASRIKDLAAEGKILAGLSCFEAGKDKFSFVALEPIPQPGKKEALRLYELIAARRTSIHTESARQVVSDMVGRNTEYDLLVKRIRSLMDGKGSVVTITGKAGIGKSRLMAELRNTDLIKNAALHEGRAFSAGQNLSYYPLIQILKSWAGIREEDNAAEAVQKLEHQIRRMFPEQADEIFPFIATLMGYNLSGKAKQRMEGIEGEPLEKLILKNLREMLALASAIRPIVIVIEDMHWIDGSSIAYLESLFKLAGNHRIMFILLMRPGYKETGEQVLKFLEENLRGLILNIFIEPLTESESAELIVNLLNKTGLPENTRQLIIDKAEGNPFFIEEVIRNFIDEGFIEVKGNHFVVTDKIQTADVPATINEVIVSRIEKLDEKINEFYGTLAYHYEKTGDKEKTEEYLLKAGDEAMKSAAHTEAISHYEKALDLIHAPGRQEVSKQYETEIKEKLGYAYYAQGHTVKAAEMFKQVLAYYIGFEMPEKRIVLALSFLRAVISFYIKMKFWQGSFSKEISDFDNKVLRIMIFQGEAIAPIILKKLFSGP